MVGAVVLSIGIPRTAGANDDHSELAIPFHIHQERDWLEHNFDLRIILRQTPHFILLLAAEDVPHMDASRWAMVLEDAYIRFFADFRRAGFDLEEAEGPLAWITLGDKERFSRYGWKTEQMDLSYLTSYYSPRTNRVLLANVSAWAPLVQGPVDMADAVLEYVADEDQTMGDADPDLLWGRITHEAAHQLAFNTGLQKPGVMYPLWVAEGLATQFEWQPGGRYGLSYPNLVRAETLLDAWRSGDLFDAERFVVAASVPARDRSSANLFYAQSWGFFHFLMKAHRGALRDYLERLASLPGRRSIELRRQDFVDHFGPPRDLEYDWRLFLERLERTIRSVGVPDMRDRPAKQVRRSGDRNPLAPSAILDRRR